MDREQLGEWESSEKVRYGRSKKMSIGKGQIEREGVLVISGNETSLTSKKIPENNIISIQYSTKIKE